MSKKINAYLTVEAACVIPIMLGVTILIISLMIYQYDRCLLEQDVSLYILCQGQLPAGREPNRYLGGQMGDETDILLKIKEGAELIKDKQITIDPVEWLRAYRTLINGN